MFQHKFIRIGGGYRHSYWMVKAMLEAIELEVGHALSDCDCAV